MSERPPSGRGRRRGKRGRWQWFPTFVGLVVAVVILVGRGGADGPATSKSNDKVSVSRVVRQPAWAYTNPLGALRRLQPGRIDMGVDYAGAGSVVALGDGTVTMASNRDMGPPSCWGRTCWPVGGIVIYRLSNGPLAGKYVYVAENITVKVTAGQTIEAGQAIAFAHDASPHIETGWASGNGPETLAMADRHQCPCGDPGGWSTIEGRTFNRVLIALGAPSGYLQPKLPKQKMPSGWPIWPKKSTIVPTPRSRAPLSEGATRGR